jgi:hypothetical protein
VRQDWLQKPTSWGRQRAYLAMFVPRTAHPVTWVAAALGMSRKLKTDRVLSQVGRQPTRQVSFHRTLLQPTATVGEPRFSRCK